MARRSSLPYLPGLDGLRSLAVVAVVLYHAGQTWIPGGFLGVEVFFVISGYIITAGLLSEWRESGRISAPTFWKRRALRLLPALFLLLGAMLLVSSLFLPDRFQQVREDSAAAAVYITNWRLIFGHVPYFETFGPPPLLQHLWSLAVEEQFYIVWPVALALLVRFLRPRASALLLIVLALGSAGLMAALYHDPFATSRIYYGTDTRASGLLLGAALALSLRPGTEPGRSVRVATNLAALAGLGGLALLFLCLSEYQPLLYRGGFLLTDVATAAVIVAVSRPRSLASRAVGVLPARWLGVRSYGIYLWHWPILLLVKPGTGSGAADLAVQVGVIVVVAALSYRLVENPARKGGLGRLARGLALTRPTTWGYGRSLGSIGSLVGVAAFMVSITAAKAPPAGASRSTLIDIPLVIDSSDTPFPAAEQPQEPLVVPEEATPPASETQPPEETPQPEEAPPEPPPPPPAPPLPAVGVVPIPAGLRIVAIGDSVMLGASRQMVYLMGSMDIDADVGRQVGNGIETLRAHLGDGPPPDIVIIGLGNNGGFTSKQFDQIMEQLAGVKLVVFVNVHVPRPWEESNNKVIERGVAAYPNAVLVDWLAATDGHPEVFGQDSVHLTGTGIRLYAGLIADAIVANFK